MDKGGLKAAVCSKWLHPIDMREHPAFASWMTYGEPGSNATWSAGSMGSTGGMCAGQRAGHACVV